METDSRYNVDVLVAEAHTRIGEAVDLTTLDNVRVLYLGKTGLLTDQLKSLGKLPKDQRPRAGQAINRAKKEIQKRIDERRAELERQALEVRLQSERIDVTLPGRGQASGGLHPVTRTLLRIEALFANAGCALTCPSKICYPSISKANKVGDHNLFRCSQSLKYRELLGMVDFDLDYLQSLGFSRFKLLRSRSDQADSTGF